MKNEKQRTANSTYQKVAVLRLNKALCFYQSLCLVDSEVLQNRHLRQAANRYHALKKIPHKIKYLEINVLYF
jgi:hypothetical protein